MLAKAHGAPNLRVAWKCSEVQLTARVRDAGAHDILSVAQ